MEREVAAGLKRIARPKPINRTRHSPGREMKSMCIRSCIVRWKVKNA